MDWKKVPLEGPDGKTDLGWIDVRSPLTRAELCVSCHVGSVEQKRVITHDMYAAGHPPLAGFELETFADKMPRHWRYSREKQKAGDAVFDRTRNTLVAAVVAMRVSAELTKADAEAAQAGRWPELARLDCFACHHELQAPGVRKVEGGTPGRPPIVVGCLPLVRVAAVIANEPSAGELAARLNQLKTPFETSPFGNPVEIVQQCDALINWCRPIEKRLASEEFKFTSQSVRALLRELAEQAAADDLDCDSARQLIAAWLVCYRDLIADDPQGLSAEQKRDVQLQFRKDEAKWLQFADAVPYAPKCGENPPPKADYQKLLERHFSDRPDFDPRDFNALMLKLASIIPR